MLERTFDDFDPYASDYRTIHNKNIALSGADSYYFAEMKVIELKAKESGSSFSILDLGCGDGLTEFYFEKYFPISKIHGIDISEKSIEVAREKNLKNAEFKVYNGSVIPYEDASFDIVFVAGVLHHVAFHLHLQLFQEIKRVLKKGGRVHIFEHNPYNPLTRYLVNTCIFDEGAKLLTPGYCKNLFKKNEWTQVNIDYLIFFPRNKFFKSILSLEKILRWLPVGGQYYLQAIKK